MDDSHPRLRQGLTPFRFDRADELDHLQPPTGESGGRFLHRHIRPDARVQRSGIELDGVKLIHHLKMTGGETLRHRHFIHFDQLKALVVRQQPASVCEQRFRHRAVRHPQLVRPGLRADRQHASQHKTKLPQKISVHILMLKPATELADADSTLLHSQMRAAE